MSENLPFTNLDFFEVKNNLKEYLKGQDQFKDYDFQGSNMNVLLDILAYNTFQNNFYTNMAISEMFLDSAELRDSVVSHAKELNYLPRSRQSSKAVVDVKIIPTDAPGSIILPNQSEFVARCGSDTYTFYTDQAYVITPSDGSYVIRNIPIYQGKYVEEYFTVSGTDPIKYVLSNSDVDISSIQVLIKDNETSTIETEYMFKENVYGVSSESKVFYLQPHYNDKYEIVFGQNVFGKTPINGNIIRVIYRRSKGEETNGIGQFELNTQIANYDSITATVYPSEGGSERESLESIRFFAPKSIQIQNRAITKNDYKILIRNNFSEIQSVAVYGGENLFPPQYGRVVVAVDSRSGSGISENTKAGIMEFLSDKAALSIEPIIINSKFMYLRIDTTVYYNRNFTNQTTANIGKSVADTITKFSLNNLEEYEKDLRYSKLTSEIDKSDVNLLSNDTTVTPFMEILPRKNFSSYYILQFENQIEKRLPYVETDLQNYTPAVFSSSFTYNGKNAFIMDNGSGKLNIVEQKLTSISIIDKDIGSVDYLTGDIILRYITVQDYPSGGIKVYARLKNKKIVAPFDRILMIREKDVTVNVTGVRE